MDDKSTTGKSDAGMPVPPTNDQLLTKKAESYLRESGKIEDYPTEQDQQDEASDRSADHEE